MAMIQGARARARSEITTAIKDEARRQLAEKGAAGLSLRAVARSLGMVSSALYRYFPSRDELLTALITDAYDALGAAAEAAVAETAGPEVTAPVRWQRVCRAVRGWALAHPHEYALVYGSPVPGYAAPEATTGPAARGALALIAVLRDAQAAGALRESGDPGRTAPHPDAVLRDAEALIGRLELTLPPAVVAELILAWAELFGLVSFEVFGQFRQVVEDREAFFDHACLRLAHSVGLVTDGATRDGAGEEAAPGGGCR